MKLKDKKVNEVYENGKKLKKIRYGFKMVKENIYNRK